MTQPNLDDLRERASRIVQADPTKMAMRSCWICNPAHEHFKEGEWGDWVLMCFGCGRFYFEGVDITEDAPMPAGGAGDDDG